MIVVLVLDCMAISWNAVRFLVDRLGSHGMERSKIGELSNGNFGAHQHM